MGVCMVVLLNGGWECVGDDVEAAQKVVGGFCAVEGGAEGAEDGWGVLAQVESEVAEGAEGEEGAHGGFSCRWRW